MRIYGIDFTCNPSRRKPVTCAVCNIRNERLICEQVLVWPSKKFEDFEERLASAGPWVMGIDAPFGLANKFIQENQWPNTWSDYIKIISELSRRDFRNFLDVYKGSREVGDKEHKREVDRRSGSMSPQNRRVNGMFYEVARRIVDSEACIPLLRPTGCPDRIILETYPGHLARNIIGRNGYKDAKLEEHMTSQRGIRERIFNGLKNVEAPNSIIDDPTGDQLDALLCAVQAAWAWSMRERNFGIPVNADPLEGWIVDESLHEAAA